MSASGRRFDLFAYGLLMSSEVVASIIGRTPETEAAVALGYQRYRVRGQRYPGLIPEPGGHVRGIVYRDLSDTDVGQLDEFESPQYFRARIVIQREKHQARAWAYLWRRELSARLSTEIWQG